MGNETINSVEAIAKKAETYNKEIGERIQNKTELVALYGEKLESFFTSTKKLYETVSAERKAQIEAHIKPLLDTLRTYGIDLSQLFQTKVDTLATQFKPLDRDSFGGMLKGLSKEEFTTFLQTLDSPELSSEQSFRLEQLALMKMMLLSVAQEFQKGGQTWTLWASRLFVNEAVEAKTSEAFKKAANESINKCVAEVIKNPSAPLSTVASKWIDFFAHPPTLVGLIVSPIQFKEVRSTKDLNAVRAECIGALRGMKHYGEARTLAKNVLAPYIEAARKTVPIEDINRIHNHNKLIVYSEPNYSKLKTEALAQGVSVEAVNTYVNTVADAMSEPEIEAKAAGKVDKTKLPTEVLSVWEQYEDMEDPYNELSNLSDENKDFIVEELCINGALILASALGGAGAGALAGRLATSLSAETLSFMRANVQLARYLTEGTRVFKGISTLGRGLHAGIEISAEALTSELFNQGIDLFKSEKTLAQVLKESPKWAMNILWSMASMGIAGRANNVVGNYPPEFISNVAGKITNAPVRKLVEEMAVKGQVEAGVELIVSCVKEGCYSGDVAQIESTFGDYLYSSYLQSAGGAGHSATRTLIHAAS